MEVKELVSKICEILASKKCTDILSINVAEKTDIADYFVVCSARSASMAKGVCEEIQEKLEAEGIFVSGIDGEREGKWVVMDYGNIIVHIFNNDMRELYKFEKLWENKSGENVTKYEDKE